MAFLDWIHRRKESAALRALARKYGHDSIGAGGAGIRHHQKLAELKKETNCEPEEGSQKTRPRPRPSWER
jgi:hypothetical protein